MRTLDLRVAAVAPVSPGVRSLALQRPGGGPLPSFPPGAHVGVEWAPGRWNPYSLTGPQDEPARWHVSVALRPGGHGGSAWMHARSPGDPVRVTAPRSTFAPDDTARHHLLVAGGIGVTPVLSHVRRHLAWSAPFTVLFVHRPGRAPHAAELAALCGDRLVTATGRAAARAQLARLLGTAPFGSHVHTCGPPGLVAAVADAARAAHWVAGRVHAESFDAPPVTGRPFRVVLRRSGRTVPVGAGESLLDAVTRAGVRAPSLCRSGVCGECVTTVHRGAVEHRDTVLAPDGRDGRMALCVSRAAGDELEIDL
ncbi:PDR/VanB family oxidoreductase [Pseudonocardia spirodelae]|uniref:PDR/VanB family oxidoreductase n=1 Tax=Pseudonocardia spirodelae TaxID=3133431 RepID=A0ABU8TDD3_9PSEU